MKISAQVVNQRGKHTATVQTNDRHQAVAIAAKADGYGSSVNGGELLFLALATCYCNDLYRASVDAKAPREAILELMRHTDTVAEIQNTLRASSPVFLGACEAREV